MTTIILTIIGILLAAVSALMVINYGGSVFMETSNDAAAATLQNNASNVQVASKLYQQAYRALPTTLADLTVSGTYLTSAPNITGIGTGQTISSNRYEVSGVTEQVCNQVNLAVAPEGDVVTAGARPDKMGCNTSDLIFYARL